jgi:hypothetical protein
MKLEKEKIIETVSPVKQIQQVYEVDESPELALR